MSWAKGDAPLSESAGLGIKSCDSVKMSGRNWDIMQVWTGKPGVELI